MARVDRIKFRHLHCLIAVAEHASSVRAAQALSLTQPAVSKTLAELEDIVGRPLYLRSPKGFELTPAGRMLLRYALQSTRALGEGMDKVLGVDATPTERIEIGALPTAAARLLPTLLPPFRATHGHVHLHIRTGSNRELIALLRKGELDLVLGRLSDPAQMKGLTFEHLYSEPMVFAVRPSHPLLKRGPVSPTDLHKHLLVLPDAGTSVRAAADQFFLTAGLGLPDNGIESIDVNFSRGYVLSNDAIWCSPLSVLQIDLDAGLLVALPLDTSITVGPVGLTLRAEPISQESLRRLVQLVRGCASTTGKARPSRRRAARNG